MQEDHSPRSPYVEPSSTKSPQIQSPQSTEVEASTTKSPQGVHRMSTTPCNPPGIIAEQDTPSLQPTIAVQYRQSPQNTRRDSSTTKSPQCKYSTQERSPQKVLKYNIQEIMRKPKIKLQDCTVQEIQPNKNLRQPQLEVQQPKVFKQQKPTKIVVLKPPTQHDQPSSKKQPAKKKKLEITETTSSNNNIRRYLSCTNISRSNITSANIQEQYLEDNINAALQTHVPDRIRKGNIADSTPVHSSLQVSKAPVPHSDERGFSQSDVNNISQSEATIFNDGLPCNKLSIGASDQVNIESGPLQNQESCSSCGLSLKREGSNPSEYVCFNCCQIDLIK